MSNDKDGRVYTAAIIQRDGKFLCLHHKAANVWLFAGGKPKPNESLLACLVRECREELGIVITDASYRQSFINVANGKEWVGTFFDVQRFTGEPTLREPEKHGDLRWMSFDEMKQYAVSQPEMGIASFCTQPSCASVPEAEGLVEALVKLSNEVRGIIGTSEPEIREIIGNSNMSALLLRTREAMEALALYRRQHPQTTYEYICVHCNQRVHAQHVCQHPEQEGKA